MESLMLSGYMSGMDLNIIIVAGIDTAILFCSPIHMSACRITCNAMMLSQLLSEKD